MKIQKGPGTIVAHLTSIKPFNISLLLSNFFSSNFYLQCGDANLSSIEIDNQSLNKALSGVTISTKNLLHSPNQKTLPELEIKNTKGENFNLRFPAVNFNKAPSFDVIIPVHNDRENLSVAISSILGQQYDGRINVIVVDDGSSDNPQQVVSSFANTRFIRLAPNQGTYTARNTGLEEANSDFVTFQDSDDISLPYRLTRTAQALTTGSWQMYIGTYLRIDMKGNILLSHKKARRRGLILMTGSPSLLRDHLGGFDRVRGGADSEFYERASALGLNIFDDNVITYLARHGGNRLTTGGILARFDTRGKQIKNNLRDGYVQNYRQWHKSGEFLQNSQPNLDNLRQFPAPSAMLDGSYSINENFTAENSYNDALQRYSTLASPYDKNTSWSKCVERGRSSQKLITAVIVSNRGGKYVERAFSQIRAFRYPSLQIIYIANAEHAIMPKETLGMDITQFIVPADKNLGYCLNLAAHHADGEFLLKIDDDDFYGPDYAAEAAAALEYDYDFIGKWSVFYTFEDGSKTLLRPLFGDLQLANHLCGATFVIRKSLILELKFSEDLHRGTDCNFIERAKAEGVLLYSTSIFNFAVNRGCNTNHTWRVDRKELLQDGEIIPKITINTILSPPL